MLRNRASEVPSMGQAACWAFQEFGKIYIRQDTASIRLCAARLCIPTVRSGCHEDDANFLLNCRTVLCQIMTFSTGGAESLGTYYFSDKTISGG